MFQPTEALQDRALAQVQVQVQVQDQAPDRGLAQVLVLDLDRAQTPAPQTLVLETQVLRVLAHRRVRVMQTLLIRIRNLIPSPVSPLTLIVLQ